MRRFFLHIALFALPFLGLGAYVLVNEPTREVAYNAVQKDCRTGEWVYKRLYQSEVPVDVAFVGTSMTMCGINDRILEERLRKEQGLDVHIANLGICRTGVNLHWLLVRDLLEEKQPKLLFVEAPQRLTAVGHPHFPYLARHLSDVFGAPLAPNAHYFNDVADFAWFRWLNTRNGWLGHYERYSTFLEDERHSFMVVADDQVADPGLLAEKKAKQMAQTENPPEGLLTGIAYALDQYAPKVYMERMAQLAAENGTELVFLYTPKHGGATKLPREHAFFQKTAALELPPDSVFDRPDLFFDPDHLNQKGAARLTDWLMEVVEKRWEGN